MTPAYQLFKKFNKYLDLLPEVQDTHGFIDSKHCDSLGFTSLLGCVPAVNPNIQAAQDPITRLWHRRDYRLPCFCDGKDLGSKSTISKDMLLSLSWFCFFNKRLDITEEIIKYALSHWGVMGEGELSRTWIGPQLLATYAMISAKLGGPKRPWLTWIPLLPAGGKNQLPYQRHLEVLHIALRGELGARVPQAHRKALQAHFRWNPENPLFAWAVGRNDLATKTLANAYLYPDDRLPTRGDRKAGWLPEHSTLDWAPAVEEKSEKHSGGDFLFCYWLLTKGEKRW